MKLSDYWVKTALGLCLITLLSITFFFDTWQSMVAIWYDSSSYNHCFLIAPISIWLCWSQKNSYLSLCPKISWLALIAVISSGFLWLIADLVNIQVIKQFAVIAMLIAGIWTLLGNRVTSHIIFPLGYLFFMIPAGGDLIAPLMEFTADFSVSLIKLSGMPVFKEGLNITLTSGNWTVAEACSGINYLIASVSLGFVYAYITFSSYWKRSLFLLLAIIVPILANGVRAYLIVMLGHFSNMTIAVGVDHIIYGALFFGLVMMVLFYVSSFWRDEPVSTQNLSPSQQIRDTSFANIPFFLALLFISVLSFVYPISSSWLSTQQQQPVANVQDVQTALVKKGWQTVENPQWEWRPNFDGVAAESMVYFSDGKAIFGLYQASFGQESQGGGELVNSQNLLVTKEQSIIWKTIQTNTIEVVNNDEKPLLVEEKVLKGSERNLVILRWYKVGTHNTNNPYLAKLFQLLKRLSNDSSPEVQVVLFTEASMLDVQPAQFTLKNVAQNWIQSQ